MYLCDLIPLKEVKNTSINSTYNHVDGISHNPDTDDCLPWQLILTAVRISEVGVSFG